jgi:hypothetical protein
MEKFCKEKTNVGIVIKKYLKREAGVKVRLEERAKPIIYSGGFS